MSCSVMLYLRQRNAEWTERYFVLAPQGDLEYYAVTDDGAPHDVPEGTIAIALRPGCRC